MLRNDVSDRNVEEREENDAVWEKFLDGEPDSKGVGLFSAGIRIV